MDAYGDGDPCRSLFGEYIALLREVRDTAVEAAFKARGLGFNSRTWRHYQTGDSLPSALTAAVLDADLGLTLSRQAGALRVDVSRRDRCAGRQCTCASKRQKVERPAGFTPRRFASLLANRREALRHSVEAMLSRFPHWWPEEINIDPLRLRRCELAASLPNVLFLVGFSKAYDVSYAELIDALVKDLADCPSAGLNGPLIPIPVR